MKKSILTKILLAMLMLALVFAMVACGGNGGKTDGPGDTPIVEDPPKETLAEQITGVLQGADPILKTLHGITADKTVGLDIGLTVDFAAGKDKDGKDVKGNYNLGVKGRLNKTAPELDVTYKAGSTDWFKLAYKDKKVYLGQPLTAVKDSTKTMDKVIVDVAELEPTVKNLMTILMDAIPAITGQIPDGIPEDMSKSVGDLLGSPEFSGVLNAMQLTITSIPGGNGSRIELAPGTIEKVADLLPVMLAKNPTLLSVVQTACDWIKSVGDANSYPTVRLDILKTGDTISSIELGYAYENEAYQGKLTIDLAVSTTDSKVGAVTAPSDYKADALEATVNALLPQKGLKGELKVDVNPNFSADYMGYASLAFSDLNNKNLGTLIGWANDGKAVYYDTAELYKALGAEAPANTVYQATLADEKSVADLINDWSDGLVEDAKEAAVKNADAAKKEPSKGILVSIYEWLGGDVKNLEIQKDKDGNESYKDPSEGQIMNQVNAKIGKYCNFTIEDKYFGTVKNIVKKFAENDEWITGIDMVDTSVVNTSADWGDLLKAINSDNFKTNDTGVYGIVNWDTTNYKGGVQLYKDGEKNDLLDAVNVFACKYTDNQQSAITVDDICDICDYYVAALGYYLGVYSEDECNKIDELDKTFFLAKNAYDQKVAKGTATDADKKTFEDAKKTHKDELKKIYTGEKTQNVLKMIFGIDNTLQGLIEGGANLYVGSVKNGGLNGFIGLKKEADSEVADTYIEIGASLRFVTNTVVTNATAAATEDRLGKAAEHELTTKADEQEVRMQYGEYIDADGFITDEANAAKDDVYTVARDFITEIAETLGWYINTDSFTEAAE